MDIPLFVGEGSHLQALIKVVNITKGPILELGTGMFSTPYLHWACYLEKRKLVSYENNIDYYNWIKVFRNDYHKIFYITDWSKADLLGHWSVALIDHCASLTGRRIRERRKDDIKMLANSVDYIVVHDTNPRLDHRYKYSEIYPLFKFRKDFNSIKPYTAVLSNFKDLSNL